MRGQVQKKGVDITLTVTSCWCYGCFGSMEGGECGTVDDSHPNSLGFLRMAERMYPILDKLLNGVE